MDSSTILFEKEDGVATITFNRPEALNALSVPMVEETAAAIADASKDEGIKVLVVTGAG